MNKKRILGAGIVVWIASTLFMWLTCGWLFTWVYEIEPKIWLTPEKMMSGVNILWANLIGLLAAIIFAGVFAYLYKMLPAEGAKKGIRYGFIVWLIGGVSGMLGMPFYMTIAWTVVIYWILQSLVLNLINGAIVGAIYKEKGAAEAKQAPAAVK